MKKSILLACLLLSGAFLVFTEFTKPAEKAALTSNATATSMIAEKESQYAVLNPRGIRPEIDRVPIMPRLSDLNGKTIYLVGQKGAGQLRALTDELTKAYPNTTFVLKGKAGFWGADEPQLWDEVAKNANAVIYGVGD